MKSFFFSPQRCPGHFHFRLFRNSLSSRQCILALIQLSRYNVFSLLLLERLVPFLIRFKHRGHPAPFLLPQGMRKQWVSSLIFSQRRFCLPAGTWRCLETLLVVTAAGKVRSGTPSSAQDSARSEYAGSTWQSSRSAEALGGELGDLVKGPRSAAPELGDVRRLQRAVHGPGERCWTRPAGARPGRAWLPRTGTGRRDRSGDVPWRACRVPAPCSRHAPRARGRGPRKQPQARAAAASAEIPGAALARRGRCVLAICGRGQWAGPARGAAPRMRSRAPGERRVAAAFARGRDRL